MGAEMSAFKWRPSVLTLGVDEAYAKALKNYTARGDVQRHLHGNTLGNHIIRNDQTNFV